MGLKTLCFALLPMALCGLILGAGCAGTTITVGDDPGHPRTARRGYEEPGRNGGPPPWAPAHGYRAKHRYRYYPDLEIYFDLNRKVSFYYRGDGWQVSSRLPQSLRISLDGDSVTLGMDTAKPYTYHQAVTERYPPGQ